MSRNTVIRQELLGRLGLEESATDQDVETAHDGLVDFLELAPHEVKSWATARTADVDKAFALLSGPEEDLVAETQTTAMAQDAPPEKFFAPAAAPVAPAAPRAPIAPVAPVAAKSRRNVYAAAIVAVIIVVVLGVWYMGRGASAVPGIDGTPTGTETTAAAGAATAAPLDQAKVAALMTKIAANPKDKVSLGTLAGLYFASADYKNAAAWEQKVLAVDPKNQQALLALGAAQFNQGDQAGAKKNWLTAAALYPKNQEVHYDLGFLYMSQTPPDSANMQAEWKKVVAIDPKSNLAKSVQTHITSTKSGATATPTAK